MNAPNSAASAPPNAAAAQSNFQQRVFQSLAQALVRRVEALANAAPPDSLASAPARGVDWLWPARIAAGRVTLLVGDPGVGKSLLALDIAARVTTAAPWPDSSPGDCPNTAESSEQHGTVPPAPKEGHSSSNPHSEIRNPKSPTPSNLETRNSKLATHPSPASVLLLCAEDDPLDTIRPRLASLGANLARVVALPPDWSPDDLDPPGEQPDRAAASTPFDLTRDIAALEQVIVRHRDVRLVIIDPLSAYLGNIENCNSLVRHVFRRLNALATRHNLAVVAISHLRKQRGSALHRTIGSLAFTAAARASWLVTLDPADPARRLMLPIKNNLAASDNGLSFTIANDPQTLAPQIHWAEQPVTLRADDALEPPQAEKEPRPSPELDDAVRWLQAELTEGAKRSRKVEAAAEAHGIRLITLRRAFRQLGGEAIRDGFGALSSWHWRLPGIGRQEPLRSTDLPWED